jgi:hypothetical protein
MQLSGGNEAVKSRSFIASLVIMYCRISNSTVYCKFSNFVPFTPLIVPS